MAGNDWINSYLEAILDVGPGIDDAKSSLLLRERGNFSPTRYFVEEVITGFDETDLHRSWVRVRSLFTPFILFYSMRLQSFNLSTLYLYFRRRPREVPRRGTPDWRTCAGGSGIWLGRRRRSLIFFLFTCARFRIFSFEFGIQDNYNEINQKLQITVTSKSFFYF